MSKPLAISRRMFTKAGAATVTLAALPARAAESQRVRLGFIGVGNRGAQLLDCFLKHADAHVVALCDVYQPYLDRANKTLTEKAPEGDATRVFSTGDFRKLIERKDVDAVVIATPDHWHAIQSIGACDAGKDVYVEKPLSITVHEGRRMVEAARRNKRIVQVGTHRRSSKFYAEAAELLGVHPPGSENPANGKLGKITVGRAYRLSNMYPLGIGKAMASEPPADLDWDMWLGPRPKRAFQDNIAPYKFRWWDLYSSQMGNWGVHYLDVIRWLTGETAPTSVCAMGGRFAIDDDRTVPDTLEATFEFASGRLAVFGQYEASGNPAFKRGEIELRGTQGTMYIDTKSWEIVPERGGQFQDRTPRIKAEERSGGLSEMELTVEHARNFLDCIKSRAMPNADVEIGHRSTTMSLLANISLATRARLDWDAKSEQITNNKEANELLHYEYRAPWKLG